MLLKQAWHRARLFMCALGSRYLLWSHFTGLDLPRLMGMRYRELFHVWEM